MIVESIKVLKERTGSSRPAILKYICANCTVDAGVAQNCLKVALKKLIESKKILAGGAPGKKGAGLFKLAPAEKVAKAPKPAKKPAAKKPFAKKPASKKPAAKKPAKTAAKKTAAKKAAKPAVEGKATPKGKEIAKKSTPKKPKVQAKAKPVKAKAKKAATPKKAKAAKKTVKSA